MSRLGSGKVRKELESNKITKGFSRRKNMPEWDGSL